MSTGPLDPNNLASTISAALNSTIDAVSGLRQDVRNLSSDVQQSSAQSSAQSTAASIEQYLNIGTPPPSSSAQPPSGGTRRRGGRSEPQRTSAQSMQDWIDENLPLPPLNEERPDYATPQEDIDFQPRTGPGSREQRRTGGIEQGIANLPDRLRRHKNVGWFQTFSNIAEDFGLASVSGVGTALMAGSAARWGTQTAVNAILGPAQQIAAPGMSQGSQAVVGGMAGAASSIAGGIAQGAAIGSILPGVGTAVGAAIGGALEVAKLPQQIMDWSDALLKSQFQIAAFNGTIQTAMMEAERREFLRNIEAGRATGGGTEALSESYQSLLDELQPIKNAVTNDITIMLAAMLEYMTMLVQGAKVLDDIGLLRSPLAKVLQYAIDWFGKDEKSDTNFDDWMNYWRGKPIAPQGPPRR